MQGGKSRLLHAREPLLPAGVEGDGSGGAPPSRVVGLSNVASDLMDVANRRMPFFGLNERRKFFHALALVIFIPGIILDVSITAEFALSC